jgi:ABC-type uncharacterized transport system substrate-binding protein
VKPTVDLALKYQLPSLSTQKSAVQAGMLISYSASFAERGRVIAGYVDQILKGAKSAEIEKRWLSLAREWGELSKRLPARTCARKNRKG